MNAPTRETILIGKIRRDGGTNPRAELVDDAVQEYAELMKDGAKFPPVKVYFDDTEYWLSDGSTAVQPMSCSDGMTSRRTCSGAPKGTRSGTRSPPTSSRACVGSPGT